MPTEREQLERDLVRLDREIEAHQIFRDNATRELERLVIERAQVRLDLLNINYRENRGP